MTRSRRRDHRVETLRATSLRTSRSVSRLGQSRLGVEQMRDKLLGAEQIGRRSVACRDVACNVFTCATAPTRAAQARQVEGSISPTLAGGPDCPWPGSETSARARTGPPQLEMSRCLRSVCRHTVAKRKEEQRSGSEKSEAAIVVKKPDSRRGDQVGRRAVPGSWTCGETDG